MSSTRVSRSSMYLVVADSNASSLTPRQESRCFPDRNPYIGAQLRGRKSSNLPNSTEDNSVRDSNTYNGVRARSQKSSLPNTAEECSSSTEDNVRVGPYIGDQRGASSSLMDWMKFGVLQHHRTQKTSIRILHFRSQPTSALMPVFALPLNAQKRGQRWKKNCHHFD